jgi:hypothetical protein
MQRFTQLFAMLCQPTSLLLQDSPKLQTQLQLLERCAGKIAPSDVPL